MIPLDYWRNRLTPKQRLAVGAAYIQNVMPAMVAQALAPQDEDGARDYARELLLMELVRLVDGAVAPKWPVERVTTSMGYPPAALVGAKLWSWWLMASREERADVLVAAYAFCERRFPEYLRPLTMRYEELGYDETIAMARKVMADNIAWSKAVDYGR